MKYTEESKQKLFELNEKFETAKKATGKERELLIEEVRGELHQFSIYQKLKEVREIMK